ncbi:hypothetical protein HOT49_gp043 [Erwinia phage vB_EamM_Alexandra]|uniref:Uncharacterized protein n=1 Tax=Erwinia phage vB_EamM_Alexandra TaxID=2201424 RepID=A0A2Z4QE15_9CAUD|nr:hypothetical protein HOT49_gp043 [Erwinia phage vB_EamM_Alexandra]AWY08323.1 hypothetical protein Alexandra_43 [Erwinia phage vB_EamM_Alexandra]
MRLLSYGACGGTPFRRLVVKDDGQFEVGVHPKIEAFGCVFTNVNVGRIADDAVEFDLPDSGDWAIDMADYFLSPEYKQWVGGHTPRIETMLDAHVIKGKLPTLVQDYDAFYADLQQKINALDLPDIVFEHNTIKQTSLNQKFDVWMLYKYNLMLDGKISVTRSNVGELVFQEDFISAKGTTWWLREHNKQLMELAARHDMLAAFITFGVSHRNQQEFFYSFITNEGDQTQRPVEPAEFLHMSVHGQFPELVITDRGKDYNLAVNYRQFFPESYHTLKDAVHITIGSNYALNLLRFI